MTTEFKVNFIIRFHKLTPNKKELIKYITQSLASEDFKFINFSIEEKKTKYKGNMSKEEYEIFYNSIPKEEIKQEEIKHPNELVW